MGKRKRFIATGLSWCGGRNIVISRDGFETEDPELINFLMNHKDYGNFIHAVPTKEEIRQQSKAYARELLKEDWEQETSSATLEVAPLSVPDLGEEARLLQEEQALRTQQQALEEQEVKERKAKNTAIREKIAAKGGKRAPKANGN